MSKILLSVAEVCEARRLARHMSATAVAKKLGKPRGVVWNVIVGKTHASVQSVPPLVVGELQERRKRPQRICKDCGNAYRRGGTTRYCGACYTYRYRHGHKRDFENLRKGHHARLSVSELMALHKQYRQGVSLGVLAKDLPFSEETLRRRFEAAGLLRRENTQMSQRLTPGIVRFAREQVHDHGVKISVIATQYGISYQTMYDAVKGKTWRSVGGPLPDLDESKRPCCVCTLLTSHVSGKCRYCRKKTGLRF